MLKSQIFLYLSEDARVVRKTVYFPISYIFQRFSGKKTDMFDSEKIYETPIIQKRKLISSKLG